MSSVPTPNETSPGHCEIQTSRLARQLYATDASIYQLIPQAVAFPKSINEIVEAVSFAAEKGWAITPRGAGSGLYGGALGDGLVLDVARYNRRIFDLNVDARTVRVQAGVVLDQLNAFLAPHGLAFGPDVATSSRATLGGMIANNSSGARAPIYGVTIDHVAALEVVTADGRIVEVGTDGGYPGAAARLDAAIRPHEAEIRERFHTGICKRWPGYAIDRYLHSEVPNFSTLFGGSEGTLGTMFSATLRLVPLPQNKGLALLFFASADEAMQATVQLLDLAPAAIEFIDDVLLDQTRGQQPFQAARDLMRLDDQPCASVLLVEFYEDALDKLEAVANLKLGQRAHVCQNAAEMALVWELRKAGLSLLTGCKGPAKPAAGIEDIAVPAHTLPEYVTALRKLMRPLGLEASFYGHAASGLLHVRPIIDLHSAEDLVKYRKLMEGASALTTQFKGSFAAEHGVGIGHTEFVAEHTGQTLLDVMRVIKHEFDPHNAMNPGKIFDDGRFKLDTNLRMGPGYRLDLPFQPVLAFADKDESFTGNLEQCNGCGGCRKTPPTMCPTFMVDNDESMLTRGRANIIRALLDGRLGEVRQALASEELDAVLSTCLSCKACTSECPSNLNMALLKAELLHARNRIHGLPISARLLSRVDLLGTFAGRMPTLVNTFLRDPKLRNLLQRFFGISALRPLPAYAQERFDVWFRRHPVKPGTRGRIWLWDDCFVRHNEPHIGRAATAVLEAAGHEVALVQGRACCGRPAFSMGRLDLARRFGTRNIALLKASTEPIVFLEPSCYSMFKQDYRELQLAGAADLAERAVLFEHFVDDLLKTNPDALSFREESRTAAIHAHCHTKALSDPKRLTALAQRVPGSTIQQLATGCCGMAGAFGAMESKYALSVQVGADIKAKVDALPIDTALIASGTSCRHQIEHLTDVRPLHMAEWLAAALGLDT